MGMLIDAVGLVLAKRFEEAGDKKPAPRRA
jgi:hypothetical protein